MPPAAHLLDFAPIPPTWYRICKQSSMDLPTDTLLPSSTHPEAVTAVACTDQTVVQLYHTRSKHRFEAYAAGPKLLDWDAQPSPFRRHDGAPALSLPLSQDIDPDSNVALALAVDIGQLGQDRPALPITLETLGVLLQHAFGITAWKTLGPDRWAVRANPSSGNLHPTEAWLIARNIPGLANGVHHYCADDHSLELRAADVGDMETPPVLCIALSSVMWREAWKYGERGFRYCQLDIGHAVSALAHAAALLGWHVTERPVGHAELSHRLGLDRETDYPNGRHAENEREEAELLLDVGPLGAPHDDLPRRLLQTLQCQWHGKASRLDPAPMYRWPLIHDIARATRRNTPAAPTRPHTAATVSPLPGSGRRASDVLLGRRSAQRFSSTHTMTQAQLSHLIACLLPSRAQGSSPLAQPHALQPVLFIHRVDGMEPGIYVLQEPGQPTAFAHCKLQAAGLADRPELFLLREFGQVELYRLARSLHCHQDIAATACLAIGLLAPFEIAFTDDPAAYRDLFRNAGLIGQSLYLGAESLGLRGTGIGCYFDEPVHKALGLDHSPWQSAYHFTIGLAIDDTRIETAPAYPEARHSGHPLEETR